MIAYSAPMSTECGAAGDQQRACKLSAGFNKLLIRLHIYFDLLRSMKVREHAYGFGGGICIVHKECAAAGVNLLPPFIHANWDFLFLPK